MDLLLMCWEFFKTGLFALGGGMATIPFLTQIAKTHPHWFTLNQLADMIAISESTPGPIGVNMATYAGYEAYGVLGGILATFSLVLPSYIVLLFIARALDRYRNNTLVNASFLALRPAVTGLIAAAGYTVLRIAVMTQSGGINAGAVALFLLILALTQWKKLSRVHPIAYIGIAAIAGIVLKF